MKTARLTATIEVDRVEVIPGEEPWGKDTYVLVGRIEGEALPARVYSTSRRLWNLGVTDTRTWKGRVTFTYSPELREETECAVQFCGDRETRIFLKTIHLDTST